MLCYVSSVAQIRGTLSFWFCEFVLITLDYVGKNE